MVRLTNLGKRLRQKTEIWNYLYHTIKRIQYYELQNILIQIKPLLLIITKKPIVGFRVNKKKQNKNSRNIKKESQARLPKGSSMKKQEHLNVKAIKPLKCQSYKNTQILKLQNTQMLKLQKHLYYLCEFLIEWLKKNGECPICKNRRFHPIRFYRLNCRSSFLRIYLRSIIIQFIQQISDQKLIFFNLITKQSMTQIETIVGLTLSCVGLVLVIALCFYCIRKHKPTIEKETWQKSPCQQISYESFCEHCKKRNPRIITECRHTLHAECLIQWLKKSDECPICKNRNFNPVRYYCLNCRNSFLTQYINGNTNIDEIVQQHTNQCNQCNQCKAVTQSCRQLEKENPGDLASFPLDLNNL